MADVNAPSGQTPTTAPPVQRIWEEFTQSIHTFIEDKWNLSQHTSGKKRATLIVIPSIWFTKLIIHHLQRKHRFHPRPDSPLHLSNEEPILGYLKFSTKGTKREIFGMPIPGRLITANIREASYYQEYKENVAKHRGFQAGETGSTQDLPAPKPAKPARKPQSTAQKAPLKPSISSLPRSSPKSVGASEAEEVPAEEPQVADEDADYQKAVEESMKDAYALPKGPLPPVVIREPESGKYQPLLEVPGKGKAEVTKEAHDLLSLQKHKKTSPTDQYILQRRISEPTASSFHDESPYEVLGQSDNKEESKKIMLGVEKGGQDKAGPDPGNAEARVQSTSSSMVYAGLDREHMDLDVANNLKLAIEELVLLEEPASSSGTLSSLQHISRYFSFGDQFFSDKHSDADKNAETKVESMVNVTIQQALSSISLMTSPIIDLTSRPESPKEHQQLKATTIDTTTTTTTTLPPPQAPQQITTEAMMVKRIGELEHILGDLIQVNKTMEERLDKHGARLYTLKQLDIPQQADIKEIHHQRMWESDSYKSHEDHMQLFEALEKSMNRVHSKELAHDLAEPPPPPPPAGPFGTSGAPRASRSQVTPPPPPPASTNQDSLSKGSAAPSLSKTTATTEHQAWTMPDVTLKPLISLTPTDLDMDEAMGPDEQALLLNEEDIRSAYILTVNLRQGWWKPFEEERPTTLEPSWSIRSSDVPVPTNNWASAQASNYSPPPEDSLLAQTDDIATFMDWFSKRRGITELKP
nr:E-beta-farnesene synthase [Tanacetum cinerariifolium]